MRGESGDTSVVEGGAAGLAVEPAHMPLARTASGKTGTHAIAHVEANATFLTVPDQQLLLTAEFKRTGADLTLIGQDGKKFIIFDYFRYEKHPDLVAPDGDRKSVV